MNYWVLNSIYVLESWQLLGLENYSHKCVANGFVRFAIEFHSTSLPKYITFWFLHLFSLAAARDGDDGMMPSPSSLFPLIFFTSFGGCHKISASSSSSLALAFPILAAAPTGFCFWLPLKVTIHESTEYLSQLVPTCTNQDSLKCSKYLTQVQVQIERYDPESKEGPISTEKEFLSSLSEEGEREGWQA